MLKLFIFILPIFFGCKDVLAVSIADRPTDDTVCDLAPSTSHNLTVKTLFVEAGTSNEAEIYVRLALRYITKNCKNGQILILHSESGEPMEDRYFRYVLSQLCSSANVQREATSTTEAPHSFQVKCRIIRIQEAANYLALAEKKIATETMIVDGTPSRRQDEERPEERSKDCGVLGFGQVMLGLGGRCPR